MADTLTTQMALKAITQPALDIYEYGKGRARAHLLYLKNEQALKAMAKRLRRIEKVKTFMSDNKEIDISTFYYPSKVIVDGSDPVTLSSLAELPSGECYVIEGTVGQGKSIFMRYLATRELKRDRDARIPIFAELRFLQPEEALETFIYTAFEASGLKISKDLFEIYAGSGRIVLFLDAFDELDPGNIAKAIRDLERLIGKYPALQIIISARPKSGIQQAAGFRVIQLASLTKQDHKPFIRLLTDAKQTTHILKAIGNSSSNITELLKTPLLLTLMVILYAARQHIPRSVPEFYGELFDVLFYKHDRGKSGFVRKRYLDLSEQKVKQLFEGVSFISIAKQYRSLKADQLVDCVEHAGKHLAIDVDVGKFRDELVKTACLLKEEGSELAFIHKSVQEFYAAAFVARSGDAFAEKFYVAARAAQSQMANLWDQPLRFLAEIDEWRYAKFYWVAIADEIAKRAEIDADQYILSQRTISLNQFENLVEGMSIGAFFTKPGAEPTEDLRHWPKDMEWNSMFPLVTVRLFGPLLPFFSFAIDMCGPVQDAHQRSSEVQLKLSAVWEGIKAHVALLTSNSKDRNFGASSHFVIEGLKTEVMCVGGERYYAGFDLLALFRYVDVVGDGVNVASASLLKIFEERARLTHIVEAEQGKSQLIALIN
jgi:hypothetical protein